MLTQLTLGHPVIIKGNCWEIAGHTATSMVLKNAKKWNHLEIQIRNSKLGICENCNGTVYFLRHIAQSPGVQIAAVACQWGFFLTRWMSLRGCQWATDLAGFGLQVGNPFNPFTGQRVIPASTKVGNVIHHLWHWTWRPSKHGFCWHLMLLHRLYTCRYVM